MKDALDWLNLLTDQLLQERFGARHSMRTDWPHHRWFRFSLRETLLITLVVALGCGWVRDRVRLHRIERLRAEIMDVEHKITYFRGAPSFELSVRADKLERDLAPKKLELTKAEGYHWRGKSR